VLSVVLRPVSISGDQISRFVALAAAGNWREG